MKMLEELTKTIESGEKKIEANDKKNRNIQLPNWLDIEGTTNFERDGFKEICTKAVPSDCGSEIHSKEVLYAGYT